MPREDANPEPSDRQKPRPESLPLPPAWQPLTWRGVAAFSQARLARLLALQCLVAMLTAAAVIGFLHLGWFPAVRAAIDRLPETGSIENQQLASPHPSSNPLVENRLLTFIVNPADASVPALTSDLRLELRHATFGVCSVFGCHSWTYPKDWVLQLNRPEVRSWWEAWKPMLYVLAGLSAFTVVFCSWLILATLYGPLVRLYAFFKDRSVTLAGSWRLAAAALLPGALLAAASLLLYAAGIIDLVRFLAIGLLHFVLAWVYLFLSPLRLPFVASIPSAAVPDPFGTEKPTASNPFASGDHAASPPATSAEETDNSPAGDRLRPTNLPSSSKEQNTRAP